MQTYLHFSNQSGSFGSVATSDFPKHAFVVIEKDQGRWPLSPQPLGYPMQPQDNAEKKMALACAQVKAMSPGTDYYMYVELRVVTC